MPETPAIFQQLKPETIKRLREIVKKTHMHWYPQEHLTDYECDRVIESFSHQTLENIMRKAIDNGIGEPRIIVDSRGTRARRKKVEQRPATPEEIQRSLGTR